MYSYATAYSVNIYVNPNNNLLRLAPSITQPQLLRVVNRPAARGVAAVIPGVPRSTSCVLFTGTTVVEILFSMFPCVHVRYVLVRSIERTVF
jgi:predicted secreted protein